MTRAKPIAIVGLGLMGGSLARDLAAQSIPLIAYDRKPEVLEAARALGIDGRLLGSDLQGIDAADLIVLATPVDVAIEFLPVLRHQAAPGAIITDVGSTKRTIGERATELGLGEVFVGSHPLAGDHRSGWTASRLGLYQGVPVFVCPTPSSTDAAVGRVTDLWSMLGAVPTLQDPAEHDRKLAWISHLPQVISSTLAATLIEAGVATPELGPGGRDMTRLADSSPEMWAAICRANSENLLQAIDEFQRHLSSARDAINRNDPAGLLEFFRRGRTRPS